MTTSAIGLWPFRGNYHYLKTKTLHILVLAFTISEKLAFPMFDLENLGHGRKLKMFAMMPFNLCKSPT